METEPIIIDDKEVGRTITVDETVAVLMNDEYSDFAEYRERAMKMICEKMGAPPNIISPGAAVAHSFMKASELSEMSKQMKRAQKNSIETVRTISKKGSKKRSKGTTIHKTGIPGPNQPCHCGSGKKYKSCHRRSDMES